MIHLKGISFKYDQQVIIDSLSLDISKGEIVAIVGNSGCGKTTLLNLLAGILKPYEGTITINTHSITYLMQDVTLLSYKTTIENVLLAYMLRNHDIDKSITQKAIELLRHFQIEHDAFHKFPNELSGGMKQRIGLVQTLLTAPDLLFLDEPFNAIDVNTLEAIESYVWNFVNNGGRTMVFITHNLEQALLLSSKIVIMRNNHTVQEVVPTAGYISRSPSQRADTEEFKNLFFEIIERMKP